MYEGKLRLAILVLYNNKTQVIKKQLFSIYYWHPFLLLSIFLTFNIYIGVYYLLKEIFCIQPNQLNIT